MLTIIGLILLWILRIIGLILGLILFLILIVLFVPFRYKGQGNFDKKVNVKVRFSWLLRLINGYYQMDEDNKVTVIKILWFKVYPGSGKPKKEKPKKEKLKKEKPKGEKPKEEKPKEEKPKEEIIDNNIKNNNKEIDEVSVESNREDSEVIVKDEESDIPLVTSLDQESQTTSQDIELLDDKTSEKALDSGDVDNSINKKTKKKDKKGKKEKKDKKDKKGKKEKKDKKDKKNKKDKKDKKDSIEKAKEMWKFLHEPENEGVLKHIIKYLVKVIKWILPKKVMIDMEVGLEDPATTGYIAAVTSIVYVMTKKNIHIIPNFNEPVVKGSFKIKGNIYLYQLLYYIIRVIIDKRVRRLIKKVRN